MAEIIRKIGKSHEEKAKVEVIEILINSDLTIIETRRVLAQIDSELTERLLNKKIDKLFGKNNICKGE